MNDSTTVCQGDLETDMSVPAVLPPVTSPVTPVREFRNEFEIGEMLPTAGKVELSEKEFEILYAPVNEHDVEIRPDGLIYLPWMEYVTRLRNAFGMNWSIIPQGMPKLNENLIRWGFWLIVRGSLMGYAIGEQEYHPGNATMSYTDACEGAKSNALMRLCKGVGISLELWKPSFIREWKLKYAETYTDNKSKLRWRKKATPQVHITPQEQDTKVTASGSDSTPTPLEVEVKKVFHALMELYNHEQSIVREVLESQIKKSSFKELTQLEMDCLKQGIERLQVRIKTGCNGRPEENGCGHCAIHYDSSHNWCSFDVENTENDMVCPYSKGGK